MAIDDVVVSRAILERYMEELLDYTVSDVAIVGAGPAGLVAAYYLALKGVKAAVFEQRLSVGGGMWGGGMMFNQIVIQAPAREVAEDVGIILRPYNDELYTANSVQAVASLASRALNAGARVFNLVSAEDVMVRENRVVGLVLNWTAARMAGLHVDPIGVKARFVVDATGHDCHVVKIVREKLKVELPTASGGIEGEKSLWAERAEARVLDHTREIYPGLYVCGMAANAVFGEYRMGPIFGGMLLSGKKVSELILEKMLEE